MARVYKSVLKTEHFAGDNLKVIGEICHQISELNKLQNGEILAVIKSDLEIRSLPVRDAKKKRPAAKGQFLRNYHSGNDLTRSMVKKEKDLVSRLGVIYQQCCELAEYDGLLKDHILALIKNYLDVHIIEEDV